MNNDRLELWWDGNRNKIIFDSDAIISQIKNTACPLYVVQDSETAGISSEGKISSQKIEPYTFPCLGIIPAILPSDLGEQSFCTDYNTSYAYYGGAMANAIASERMVIELGRAGFMGSFGTGGLSTDRVEEAIKKIQKELPAGPFAFNLLYAPGNELFEKQIIDIFLKYRIRALEASAFLTITPPLVSYRAHGLSKDINGKILIKNKIIAKISRREVAEAFMRPPAPLLINDLVIKGLISKEQAELALQVPLADDITVEADSGGHTDNRPLLGLLPTIMAVRDEINRQYTYQKQIRVGAAGGISNPQSALASFMMGAAYIVTGSINQSTVEAGTSEQVKILLAQADMADVMMTPSSDMFEMGVRVQVLKRGTMYPLNAKKLHEHYLAYNSIEAIPSVERDRLEKKVFKKDIQSIWTETVNYFQRFDPSQIERANKEPKHKMALIFRWYLGKSSQWAIEGDPARTIDYQIWCGPAIGAFNQWVKGTYLERHENRHIAAIAQHILLGAAGLYRLKLLQQIAGTTMNFRSADFLFKPDITQINSRCK
jgi:trans-AT polyketide synthase/acyltransferase/oxidoreductase domain-containing protein